MKNQKLMSISIAVAAFAWGIGSGEAQVGPNPAVDYTVPNYSYSPPLRKFVDSLPGLSPNATNNLGQYIPIATADTNSYPGSDYYEIALVEYREQMHSDLPPVVIPPGSTLGKMDPAATGGTKLRGYVQELNGTPLTQPHYMGPMIIATSGRAVRVKFTNRLPIGASGDLFLPTDVTYMGAGLGPDGENSYTQNRATLHLHGGVNPWISDGTPHQWTAPAGEGTPYPKGDSTQPVPDMPLPSEGSMTFYWPNQTGSRMMFYHDHAYGLTRLNVYGGEAAGYLVLDRPGTGEWTLPIPGLADTIPLVIQDKTFVPDSTALQATDPLWDTNKWGGLGNLWFQHVYMPNQDPTDNSGANALGRWDYGPWFWPPWPVPAGMVLPTVSGVPESFMDTPVVNGTAYPYVNVQPKAYRLRILNACNDRMVNLQLYQAEPIHISVTNGGNNYSSTPVVTIAAPLSGGVAAQAVATVEAGVITAITVTNAGSGYTNRESPTVTVTDSSGTGAAAVSSAYTEVAMIPAVRNPAISFPPGWLQATPGMIPDLLDNRTGGIPTPVMRGPAMIQIGTEGGLLPAPTVLPNTPVGYEQNKRNIVVLNISAKTLLMGPAERADIIVDFTPFAGKTIILYNDAPAPVPAGDPRNDLYTDNPDFSITGGDNYQGGTPSTVAGYGPNTRTIMQFRVAGTDSGAPGPVDYYNTNMLTALQTALPAAFKDTQPVPIVPQSAFNSLGYTYNGVPGGAAPDTYLRIQSTNVTYIPYGSTTPVVLPLLPKCIQELFDPLGRMNSTLGVELPFTTAFIQTTIPYGYIDPITEVFNDGETQFWKITHNGVDTHALHFHLVNVQIINRVGWDGSIRPPDANEMGWKDTVRMHPLEDIVVATRAITPTNLPFTSPDSIRRMDVTQPVGSAMGFAGVDPITGNPVNVTNKLFNYGWEYVWHCHLLGHEENDMMRPISVVVPLESPSAISPRGAGYEPLPTYQFGSVARATGYQIAVWNTATGVGTTNTWKTPQQAGLTLGSGAGVGSLTQATTLALGQYAWAIRATNAMTSAVSAWSAPTAFSVLSLLAPTPLSPQGSGITNLPVYTFSGVPGATGYQLYVGDSTGAQVGPTRWYTSADPGFPVGTNVGSITQLSNPLPPGTYSWLIRAQNASGTGPWSYGTHITFTVGSPPAVPTTIGPVGNITNTSPVYRFTPVAGATGYQIYLWNSAAGSGATTRTYTSAEVGASSGTGTITQSPALSLGIYVWYVRALNAAGAGNWSSPVTFTVVPPPSPLPAAPTTIGPVGNTTNTSPVYTFTAVAGATGYQISLWNSSAATSTLSRIYTAAEVGAASGTGTITQSPALSLGVYAWYVRAINAAGVGPWSPAVTITVTPPAPSAPTTISPVGSTTNTSPVYTFTAVPGATGYQISLWNSSAATSTTSRIYTAAEVGAASGTGTITQSPALSLGIYTWYVRAVNAAGPGPWSPAVTFTITPPPLPAPAAISPTGSIATTAPVYTFNAVSGATGYQISLWNSSAATSTTSRIYTAAEVGASSGTGTITQSPTLTPGIYAWYVRSINGTIPGPWSAPLTFVLP